MTETISTHNDKCRVCLKKNGEIPIFGNQSKPDISIEISTFGGIQLQEMDNLPKLICKDCFKLLRGAILFRKSAKRTDALLRKKQCIVKSIKKEEIDCKLDPLVQESEEKSYSDPINQNENNIDFVPVDMNKYLKHDDLIEDTEYEDKKSDTNVENNAIVSPETSVEKKPTMSYNCKYCNVTLESFDTYEEHRTTVEHKRNYVMSFLPKKTVNPKDRLCELCNRVFTKMHFTRHMLSEHNIKTETSRKSRTSNKKKCTLCNKMFHPGALNNHMKKIHGQEKNHIKKSHGQENEVKPKVKLECPVCKKVFSKPFYPLHMQRHKQGDTRNYICEQCGKKFFFKSSYFTHRLIHTNALPHKCEHCPYRGRTKDLLKIHVRTHTGDYPYKCTQCDTRCTTKSNLNSHMRRHRGPIDFICDTCSRGFYSKIQLERHISVAHHGVKNHICPICGAAFGYRNGLMGHQRKVHKRPKGLGKPKAVYLQLEEEGLLPPESQEVLK